MRCKALIIRSKTRCKQEAVIKGLCLQHLKSSETKSKYICPDCKGFKTWGAKRCGKCSKQGRWKNLKN